jgi:hypothetical protein
VDLVRTAVSEELSASFIRVTRIGELGTTLALTLREPHGVTSQKTPFFIVIAVKTSNPHVMVMSSLNLTHKKFSAVTALNWLQV